MKRDWSEWNFGDVLVRLSEKQVRAAAMANIDLVLDAAYIVLPGVYGATDDCNKPVPSDPLTVYIRVNEGAGSPPTLTFSIAKELNEYIKDCKHDGSYADGLEKIADAMDKLSKRIRRAVATGGAK
jgi:hypothetical protein